MDWKVFAQIAGTVVVALIGGWLGHTLSALRDLVNERRKLRITYLLEAYRRLEDAGSRDEPERSWPKLESAIADIQLLGSPEQVRLAGGFALGMARDKSAPLDELINDLRRSLREELRLPAVTGSVVYLRFNQGGPPTYEQTARVTVPNVEEAKAEGAAIAPREQRRLLDEQEKITEPVAQIIGSWDGLERQVQNRLQRIGVDTSKLGSRQILDMAFARGIITDVQHRSLRGLNTMRNLAVHGRSHGTDSTRALEFLDLADAMKTVLEITDAGAERP